MKNYILEGIRFEHDKYILDFNIDKESDIVNLHFQKFNKAFSIKNGESVFYGYKINKNVNDALVKNFRIAVKTMQIPEIESLINKSITGFDALYPVSKFDIIITPKSSSPLNSIISKKIKDKAGVNTLIATDLIVKNAIENIQVDYTKIHDTNLKTSIEKIINAPGGFKITNVPPQYRKLIMNYLKFSDDTSRRIFNAITKGNVLLIDDILTTGSTILEMSRLTKSLGADNIMFYIFLSNKK